MLHQHVTFGGYLAFEYFENFFCTQWLNRPIGTTMDDMGGQNPQLALQDTLNDNEKPAGLAPLRKNESALNHLTENTGNSMLENTIG